MGRCPKLYQKPEVSGLPVLWIALQSTGKDEWIKNNDDEKNKRSNYNLDGHKKARPKNNKLLKIPKQQSMPRKVK